MVKTQSVWLRNLKPMKLSEVNKKYQSEAIVDKDGEVLCPVCKVEKAWVAWGRIEPCQKCEKVDLIKGLTMH